MASFTSKDDDETIRIGFDFAELLDVAETISTATFAIRDVSDQATTTGMLSGTAAIVGSVVTHKITGGEAGIVYRISCTIDTSGGLRYVESADITVTERE